jgi:hypothetical protein
MSAMCGDTGCNSAALRSPFNTLPFSFGYRYYSRSGIIVKSPLFDADIKMAVVFSDTLAKELAQSSPTREISPVTGRAGIRYGTYANISPERAL